MLLNGTEDNQNEKVAQGLGENICNIYIAHKGLISKTELHFYLWESSDD